MNFKCDIFVVCRETANIGQICESLFPSTNLGKVTRRLFTQEHTEEKNAAGDELKSERNDPLLGRHCKIVIDSVRDPESENCADLEHNFEESNESPTDSWRGDFSNIDL
jgi:hypothetical protein